MGEDTGRHETRSLAFLSFFLSSSSSSFAFFLSKKNANRFLNRISKSAANCVLSARKLTRCIRSLSLSLSATTNQTGIQKLKNLLDNKNGANGEEPQGFDATEFMGHYT